MFLIYFFLCKIELFSEKTLESRSILVLKHYLNTKTHTNNKYPKTNYTHWSNTTVIQLFTCVIGASQWYTHNRYRYKHLFSSHKFCPCHKSKPDPVCCVVRFSNHTTNEADTTKISQTRLSLELDQLHTKSSFKVKDLPNLF